MARGHLFRQRDLTVLGPGRAFFRSGKISFYYVMVVIIIIIIVTNIHTNIDIHIKVISTIIVYYHSLLLLLLLLLQPRVTTQHMATMCASSFFCPKSRITTARNLATTPKGQHFGINIGSCFL